VTPEPLSPELAQQLWKEELAASQSAYAPYSNFHVGAALLTTGGEIVTGCNVENASYGLTTCAERTAIARAVAEQKLGDDDMRIRAIAVTNHEDQPCTPCGACRQIIMEFGREAMVLYGNSGQRRQSPITELLPESFQL
jgi:cytidine deaminase